MILDKIVGKINEIRPGLCYRNLFVNDPVRSDQIICSAEILTAATERDSCETFYTTEFKVTLQSGENNKVSDVDDIVVLIEQKIRELEPVDMISVHSFLVTFLGASSLKKLGYSLTFTGVYSA